MSSSVAVHLSLIRIFGKVSGKGLQQTPLYHGGGINLRERPSVNGHRYKTDTILRLCSKKCFNHFTLTLYKINPSVRRAMEGNGHFETINGHLRSAYSVFRYKILQNENVGA